MLTNLPLIGASHVINSDEGGVITPDRKLQNPYRKVSLAAWPTRTVRSRIRLTADTRKVVINRGVIWEGRRPPPQGKRKKEKKERKKEKREKKEEKREKRKKGTMNNVKLLNIKYLFFQFFNSQLALKNIKKFWPPKKKLK